MGVYIWTDESYIPTSNTIAYFPLGNNQLDKLGNYTLSSTGTKEEIGFSFSGSCNFVYSGSQVSERFLGYWVKPSSTTGASLGLINVGGMRFQWNNSGSTNKAFVLKKSDNTFVDTGNLGTYSANTWYYIAFGIDSSNNYKGYINAVQKMSGTATPASYSESWLVGGSGNGTTIFSEVIVENRLWSASEVSEYYNRTKGAYGL